jgi:CubicO group peptidase (beta-lactamase class C family)
LVTATLAVRSDQRRRNKEIAAPKQLVIDGAVSRGLEPVREAFIENFTRRGELGGACCIYQHGEKVVDLWGGLRDRASGEPWREDTMVVVHSTTKGLAAMVMALAHSRGWLDYDARVATYWPEFAQNGKERTTVRQLLAYQAGLFAFDEPEAASAPRSMGYAPDGDPDDQPAEFERLIENAPHHDLPTALAIDLASS